VHSFSSDGSRLYTDQRISVSQNNNPAKPKGRQRSSSELPAREAAMLRKMSMVGPETVTEENGSENSEGVLIFYDC
jgi:hypothetical protein